MHHKVQGEVIVRHGSDTHGEGRDLYALSLKMIDEGPPPKWEDPTAGLSLLSYGAHYDCGICHKSGL